MQTVIVNHINSIQFVTTKKIKFIIIHVLQDAQKNKIHYHRHQIKYNKILKIILKFRFILIVNVQIH